MMAALAEAIMSDDEETVEAAFEGLDQIQVRGVYRDGVEDSGDIFTFLRAHGGRTGRIRRQIQEMGLAPTLRAP